MSRQVRGQMTDLRLTFIDLWWPQNLAFRNLCMMYIKRKLGTQGYHLRQPFFSALDYMASDDHDLTSRDLFGPWKLKNFHTYPVLRSRSPFAKLYCLSVPMSWLQHSKQGWYEFIDQAINILAISLWFKITSSPVHTIF